MGGMNWKCSTAIKGTVNHAKTSFSTEIFAGAIISVIQYLAPLRYCSDHKRSLYKVLFVTPVTPLDLRQQKSSYFTVNK
jgi:hypothetical protein